MTVSRLPGEMSREGDDLLHAMPGHRLIRASAGSGKTFQLTNRYLGLLARGVPAGSVLATTFTRKAAGEILARVLGRLAGAAASDKKRQELNDHLDLPQPLTKQACLKMLREVAEALHRLSICTIDSFFNRIASSFRLELDVPMDPQIVDEKSPIARQLRLEAIEAMLADQDLHVLLELLRRLHHDSVARSVTAAIDGIVGELYDVYREAPERQTWSRIVPPAGLMDEVELAAAVESLRGMAGELPKTGKGTPNKHWLNAFAASVDAVLARDWEALLKSGVVAKIVGGEEEFGRQPIEAVWHEVYSPLIAHATAQEVEHLAQRVRAMHALLARFDDQCTRLRREHGVLLFSDLTHKLARTLPTLGDDLLMEVYYRLDGQVTHLLLDEFQDTSLEQWRVLGPFVEEVVSHADGSRSFFCVGDVKQALYGWRGGCVELFDEVEQGLAHLPEARKSLSQSWRSSQVVLDAVNEVFTDLASCSALDKDAQAAQCWQDKFEVHTAAKNLPGHVQLLTSTAASAAEDCGDDADEEQDELAPASAHERFAAEVVAKACERAPGRSVGVLVSTNRGVNRLLFELRQRGVHASGEGGNPLTDSPAVAAVLAAMTLADHPGHSTAAFHVANSPLGAVVGLRGTQAGQVHAAALRLRAQLIEEGYAGVIGRWVRVLAPSCNGRDLARLTQLVELAEQYGAMLTLRPGQFVEYVKATPVEEPSPAPVRVMTVHAAKGLEFDIVVLPELNRKLSDRWPILVERAEPTGPITGVYPGAKEKLRALAPEIEEAYLAQRAREREEDFCNLYVAMTRAKHALYMVLKPLAPKKDGSPKSTGLCFASVLRERLRDREETFVGREILYSRGDENWASESKREMSPQVQIDVQHAWQIELADSNQGSRRAWRAVSPSGLEGAGKVRAADLLDLANHRARRRGSLIHAWFEQVEFVDEALPDDAALLAAAERVAPGADRKWVIDQIKQWRVMREQPTVRQALSRNGEAELWRERAFAVRDVGKLLRGTFDRVTIKRDGGRATGATLTDFKTDRYSPDVVERYRPQMQAYRRALGRMLNLKDEQVQARLLFVGSDKLVAL